MQHTVSLPPIGSLACWRRKLQSMCPPAPDLDLIEWFSGVESEVRAFQAAGYRALGCSARPTSSVYNPNNVIMI